MVAFAPQAVGKTAEVVERGGGKDKRLDKVGHGREGGRHGVNALAAVGKSVLKGEGMFEQRIEERSVGNEAVCCRLARQVVL